MLVLFRHLPPYTIHSALPLHVIALAQHYLYAGHEGIREVELWLQSICTAALDGSEK